VTIDLLGVAVRFADPFVLLLLVTVPALLALGVSRERRGSGGLLFASLSLLPGRRRSWRGRLRPLLIGVRGITLVLLIVALARPQVAHGEELTSEGIDIAIIVDVSGSMSTADFDGQTRIEAVKSVVRDFVGGLTNDRVGVVVFGSDALLLSPLTLDYEAVQTLVKPLQADGRLVGGSTAIGTGLATGLNALRSSSARSKVAIVLTDGENNSGQITPLDATKAAKVLGIRVYTIGAIPQRQRRSGGVEVDEALMREMAETTGGQYFTASDAGALLTIYKDIASLERTRIGVRTLFASYQDVMLPLLLGAGLLLVIEILLGLTLLRRTP
jgi:Ca-activated chloride channel family protein